MMFNTYDGAGPATNTKASHDLTINFVGVNFASVLHQQKFLYLHNFMAWKLYVCQYANPEILYCVYFPLNKDTIT